MQEDKHSDSNTGADATNVPAPDGNETASEVVESKELHEVLNEQLGTTYKTPEDALSGLKELRSYAGKAGKYEKAVAAVMQAKSLTEDQAVNYIMENTNSPAPQAQPVPEVPEDVVTRKELEEIRFYDKNPDLEPFKTVINAVAEKTGKPLAEAVTLPEIKILLEAKSANDQAEKSKSVLVSNPRIGQVQDKLAKAQEARNQGNLEAGAALATEAVIEAYEMK